MRLVLVLVLVQSSIGAIIKNIKNDNEDLFHYYTATPDEQIIKEDKEFWYQVGEEHLQRNIKFHNEPKLEVAKNVIILIGDGMGLSTITATRIYKGQREFGKSGEDHNLVYDKFPNVALVKTYNVDMQVPDSAGTATALFTGVKTRYEALGIDATSNKTFIKNTYDASKVRSIMTWAQEANKDTGIITTARITHATPAGTYAHANEREWECDSKIPEEYRSQVKDISRQLIEDLPGKNFKVILGGGHQQLGYTFEDEGGECLRLDKKNLTQTWVDQHNGSKAVFVTNTEGLGLVDDNTEYVLGLFDPDHMPYDLLRDKSPKGVPSLTEMTRKGLQILKKNPNGFVLMVEGGRIDHGHHANKARIALQESSEFDNTIQLVVNETGPETLIIVTADHSHALTLNGYAYRGTDILGYGITNEDNTKKSSLTLTYANGPGYEYHYMPNDSDSVVHPWRDPRTDSNLVNNESYLNMAAFHLDDETHGGEDVAVFATGPCAHYIRGVVEQNYIAHLISYAACIGPRASLNKYCISEKSSSSIIKINSGNTIILFVLVLSFI